MSPACAWPAYRRSEPPCSRDPEGLLRVELTGPGLGREGLEAAHQRHTVDQPGASAVVRRRDEAIDLDGERVRGLDRCRVVLFAGDLQANRQIPLDKADRSAVAAR